MSAAARHGIARASTRPIAARACAVNSTPIVPRMRGERAVRSTTHKFPTGQTASETATKGVLGTLRNNEGTESNRASAEQSLVNRAPIRIPDRSRERSREKTSLAMWVKCQVRGRGARIIGDHEAREREREREGERIQGPTPKPIRAKLYSARLLRARSSSAACRIFAD